MGKEMRSQDIKEISLALAKAQANMRGAEKDSVNPHFKNKYATLKSIWDSIRRPLSENGLSVTQTIAKEGDDTMLITTLLHVSGQWISSEMPIISPRQPTPQAFGSALTYTRRYSLSALVGCTETEDDDGEEIETHYRKQQNFRSMSEVYITKEQVEQIEQELEGDMEHRQKILAYYSTKLGTKMEDFTKLPKECFDSIMKAFVKKKEKQVQGGV